MVYFNGLFFEGHQGTRAGWLSHILVSYRNIYTLIERDRTIPRRSGMGEEHDHKKRIHQRENRNRRD